MLTLDEVSDTVSRGTISNDRKLLAGRSGVCRKTRRLNGNNDRKMDRLLMADIMRQSGFEGRNHKVGPGRLTFNLGTGTNSSRNLALA